MLVLALRMHLTKLQSVFYEIYLFWWFEKNVTFEKYPKVQKAIFKQAAVWGFIFKYTFCTHT